jgi:ubiquitin C-terminal hydrolase
MGHYTAFVKRGKEWFYADDSSFKRRDLDGSEAYLLFYRNID